MVLIICPATVPVVTEAATVIGSVTSAFAGTATVTSGAVSASGGIAYATSTAGMAVAISNPVVLGVLLVGAEVSCTSITWDCWKPVVHDESEAPSLGMTLEELTKHENVERIFTNEQGQMMAFNKFGETFELVLVNVSGHGLAFHAQKIV